MINNDGLKKGFDYEYAMNGIKDNEKHWLDFFDYRYHANQEIPEYLLVTPDGKWEMNKLPE